VANGVIGFSLRCFPSKKSLWTTIALPAGWCATGAHLRDAVKPSIRAVLSTAKSTLVRAAGYSLRPGNQDLIAARILRDEKLSLRNVTLDCSVIEAQAGPVGPALTRSYLLWVDQQTGVVVKQQLTATREEGGRRIESVSSLVVRRMLLDVPINEKLFEFELPAGSKLVTRRSGGERLY